MGFSYAEFTMFLVLFFNPYFYISCHHIEPFSQSVKFKLHLIFSGHQPTSQFKTVLSDCWKPASELCPCVPTWYSASMN